MHKSTVAYLVKASAHCSIPLHRLVLAWTVMVVSLVGFWCSRPWLETRVFNYGQLAVLLVTWKIASLLCLPTHEWRRFTPLRLLAYCTGMVCSPGSFSSDNGEAPAHRFLRSQASS